MPRALRYFGMTADEKDIAELIMGYPLEELLRKEYGGGRAYYCGEYAYSAGFLSRERAFWEDIITHRIRSVWMRRGAFIPLPEKKRTPFFFSRMQTPAVSSPMEVELLHYAHAADLMQARQSVPEFTARMELSALQVLIMQDIWKVFCLREEGRLVASATAVTIRDDVFKVQSVFTVRDARRRGLARRVLQGLLENLGNARLLLMFDNPHAGDLYHSLGFEDFAVMDMIDI